MIIRRNDDKSSRTAPPMPSHLGWGLVHHQHSFKVVQRRYTHYPFLALVLLMALGFSLTWTSLVKGASYAINASILAPPLTEAATITSPADGSQLDQRQLTVGGRCPANSYVKLYRQSRLVATAPCRTDGSWQAIVWLYWGSNNLRVQAFNITDQPGPSAPGIMVRYLPAAGPANTASANNGRPNGAGAGPSTYRSINVAYDFNYLALEAGQAGNWQLNVTDGVVPYQIKVDWSDGQIDNLAAKTAGPVDLEHTYQRTNGAGYTIAIEVRDAAGQIDRVQLFAVVRPRANAGSAAAGTTDGSGAGSVSSSVYQAFWRAAGPAFAVSAAGLGIFWLGETHKLVVLRHLIGRGRL